MGDGAWEGAATVGTGCGVPPTGPGVGADAGDGGDEGSRDGAEVVVGLALRGRGAGVRPDVRGGVASRVRVGAGASAPEPVADEAEADGLGRGEVVLTGLGKGLVVRLEVALGRGLAGASRSRSSPVGPPVDLTAITASAATATARTMSPASARPTGPCTSTTLRERRSVRA